MIARRSVDSCVIDTGLSVVLFVLFIGGGYVAYLQEIIPNSKSIKTIVQRTKFAIRIQESRDTLRAPIAPIWVGDGFGRFHPLRIYPIRNRPPPCATVISSWFSQIGVSVTAPRYRISLVAFYCAAAASYIQNASLTVAAPRRGGGLASLFLFTRDL